MRTPKTFLILSTFLFAGALALGCGSKTSAAECKALEAAADKADEKAVQLIVPGVDTYADFKKAADEVEEASKIFAAVDIKGAELKAIRDQRTKQLDEFVAAVRALKGDAAAEVPKGDAEKISKLSSGVTTGAIDMIAATVKICPQ